MNVLGAILAGGEARRFGSDKALAMLDGVTLIDRVRAALTPQVAAVVVCGRVGGIADRPAGIGPLGGIAAAIWQARERGMDGAVTVPCDAPGLPDDLVARLAAAGGVSGGAGTGRYGDGRRRSGRSGSSFRARSITSTRGPIWSGSNAVVDGPGLPLLGPINVLL
jgi:molybdopterin-guanine dinucleotide biosynthesis protein A